MAYLKKTPYPVSASPKTVSEKSDQVKVYDITYIIAVTE